MSSTDDYRVYTLFSDCLTGVHLFYFSYMLITLFRLLAVQCTIIVVLYVGYGTLTHILALTITPDGYLGETSGAHWFDGRLGTVCNT